MEFLPEQWKGTGEMIDEQTLANRQELWSRFHYIRVHDVEELVVLLRHLQTTSDEWMQVFVVLIICHLI